MLEVHRWRRIDWWPSAVVALATSVNGTVVAAARENGAIELWNVAPGSTGWHCVLTIPGKEDAAISSLVWCKSRAKGTSPLGRLFSAGLDGFITEWDLETLLPKEIVESYGGSVWQLAAEPILESFESSEVGNGHVGLQNGSFGDSDGSSDEDDSDSEDDEAGLEEAAEQRVAVGCDDGCLRLFTVGDEDEGMVYRRSFPRVKGRILSVAWSVDGSKIYAGGSGGSIHCWDSHKVQELYRITAGIGGVGGGTELCVWTLLVLRDGTLVSGDSSGSTQFWDGKHGTLLQALAKHGADVLALAASPSHRGVYAAGADGQVILYQHIDQSVRDEELAAGAAKFASPSLDKWVYIGSKRSHTHDVKALAVAFPREWDEGQIPETKVKKKRVRRRDYHEQHNHDRSWVRLGAAMLISGGNDAKLFAYPADMFLTFRPHEICSAPQRPHVQLTSVVGTSGAAMFMVQYPTWVDVWRIHSNSNTMLDLKEGLDFRKEVLGKRKVGDEGIQISRKNMKSNGGGLTASKASDFPACNGNSGSSQKRTEMARTKGISPELVARIKAKSAEHICCSAISGNGQYLAFSDRLMPRLYELDREKLGSHSSRKMSITKSKLPANIPAAQSMQFTQDSSRLLLGRPEEILVIDVEDATVVHTFPVDPPGTPREESAGLSPLKLMCTSADSQWLAAITSNGYVHIFNLETLTHHWSIPVPDGSVATSAIFRLGSSNVLIISTSTNQIHVLNVEVRELSEWSAVNGAHVTQILSEFPGPIIGLSVPPTSTSTSVIAYSSSAMCNIDFSRSLRENTGALREDESLGTSSGASHSSAQNNHVYAGENGVDHKANGHSNVNSNFVVVDFKDPVLFLGHTTPSSVLVVEKPWLDVLRKFPAPVFRHLYGT